MRLLLFPLLFPGLLTALRADDVPRPATAEETALFQDALRNSAQDTEHWAYTETTRAKVPKGLVPGETVVRFDPSKPYAEQYTPLQIDGQPPTEKQLKEYRRRGEKRGARVAEAARNSGPPPASQLKIAGGNVTLDPDHPRVARTEEGRVVFEVPMLSARNDIPVDKFLVLAAVDRATRQVERVDLRVRESFRVKLVAKVKAGEASLGFTVVDPRFGPVVSAISGDFSASLLFIPVNGTFERTRADWKRVKSYNERLQVKLGPLQLSDF
ncbi:hypothetical protein [Opitutus sp. GAS368]|jgi:hypothetical protein|uniref:hypothetical protein n=1 Tax=Opitutus sp. GAS368 TaxID=1882749 RepID=UPI00087B1ECC|nr:hypothetical protein [Opitutus sp. GAS368]SDR89049.1 hypothetical protein SAMN05444173_1235 [Opitutus sp. GAS368]